MKKIKLSKHEKDIEEALLCGEYVSININEFKQIARLLKARKEADTGKTITLADLRRRLESVPRR